MNESAVVGFPEFVQFALKVMGTQGFQPGDQPRQAVMGRVPDQPKVDVEVTVNGISQCSHQFSGSIGKTASPTISIDLMTESRPASCTTPILSASRPRAEH